MGRNVDHFPFGDPPLSSLCCQHGLRGLLREREIERETKRERKKRPSGPLEEDRRQ